MPKVYWAKILWISDVFRIYIYRTAGAPGTLQNIPDCNKQSAQLASHPQKQIRMGWTSAHRHGSQRNLASAQSHFQLTLKQNHPIQKLTSVRIWKAITCTQHYRTNESQYQYYETIVNSHVFKQYLLFTPT